MTAAARRSRRILVVGATRCLGVAIGEALADPARPATGNAPGPFVIWGIGR